MASLGVVISLRDMIRTRVERLDAFVARFKTPVSDSSHDVSHSEHTSWEKTAFAKFQSLSGHLDHVCKEVSLLYYIVEEIESSIAQKVSDDIKSSVLDLISHS
ncbi:hypothetical protein Tco_0454273 [Tanacetum coccineum]